jgi:hypothetical protein
VRIFKFAAQRSVDKKKIVHVAYSNA